MKRKKLLIVCLIAIILLLLIIFGRTNDKQKQDANVNTETNEEMQTTASNAITPSYVIRSTDNNGNKKYTVSELQSRNLFFCIEKIMDNFFSLINSNKSIELINVIDDKYLVKNGISASNVMSLFDSYNLSYYLIDKVSYIDENNFIVKFRDGSNIENYSISKDHVVLIKLDNNTKSYYIIPNFDESNFESEIIAVRTINRNENNGYTIEQISDKEVGEYYLKLFEKVYNNDIDSAMEIVNQDETNSINTKSKLKDYMGNITISYENIDVKATKSERYVIFEVIDGNNNYFKFTVYPNYTEFYVKLKQDSTKGQYFTIYNDYDGDVSNEDISVFMDGFINNSIKQIKNSTSGLSHNKIRKYYADNTQYVNDMVIYSADDFLNLSNQIVGMRWSKGIEYIEYIINGKKEDEGYVIYDLTLQYTQEAQIKMYLCIAKDSNTNPKIKIETTGVEEE